MTRLPSLRNIEAFEAVGRTGSVSAAASELGISPGAISQQIQALERHLKFHLIQRRGRGIELTPWGTLYLRRVAEGMQQLRKAREEVERARRSKHLIISALPSLAIGLLGPLMFEWKALHPDIDILIDGKDPEPHLQEGEADFRISYGGRRRHHTHYTDLFTDRVIPVASPALLSARRRASCARDLLDYPLIWVDWGQEYLPPPSWQDWFALADIRGPELRRDLTFSLPTGAIYAAIEGRGVALAQHSMAASALETGTLMQVLPVALPLPEVHFLAWDRPSLEKPFGAAFHDWLIGATRRLMNEPV